MESVLLDAAGHRRSPATMPGYHRGRPPRNKGEQYPADPPTIEEIIAVVRTVGDRPEGHRLRALIVLLWRAGLRISEALAVQESDLDRSRGAVLVRRGKGGKRREVGMDRWAWEQIDPWLESRRKLPTGAVLCVIHGATAGRRWEASASSRWVGRRVPADPARYLRLATSATSGARRAGCGSGLDRNATCARRTAGSGGKATRSSRSPRSSFEETTTSTTRWRQWQRCQGGM